MPQEVFERWGFGMAPPKPVVHQERMAAASSVLNIIEGINTLDACPKDLENISIVKGLFNRVLREDQWDWFTVAGQLGYPSPGLARVIAIELSRVRMALIAGDGQSTSDAKLRLCRLPTRRCLSVFLGQKKIVDEDGAGWLYVLSTRELRDLLKIGMTTRTVEERAREINAATGIAIPFGVRRCWRVMDPARAERMVHGALAGYRLRNDREFFRAELKVADPIVRDVLSKERLEIRTLDRLAALA